MKIIYLNVFFNLNKYFNIILFNYSNLFLVIFQVPKIFIFNLEQSMWKKQILNLLWGSQKENPNLNDRMAYK